MEYLDRLFGCRHPDAKRLSLLGQRLGELNDLCMLSLWLESQGAKPGGGVMKLLRRQMKQQRKACVKAFDNAFEYGGKRFVRCYRRRLLPAPPESGDRGPVVLEVVVSG